MKKVSIRAAAGVAALAFIIGSIPISAFASHNSGTEDGDNTGGSSWGDVSSSVRRKISDLDNSADRNLPIPILAGITVGNLTKNFGDARGGGTRSHEGLDIMAPKGAYIASPTEAVVIRVGTGSSSGKYVTTANPGGENFVYMHLDDFAEGLRVGDVLDTGDLIGYVGNTGNASGGAPHLHFELRDGRTATDPYPRLTREFTLKERIASFKQIISDADDEDDALEDIVMRYRAILISAQASGIDLTKDMEEALGLPAGTGAAPTGTVGYSRDLELGARGDDVVQLQAFLIAKESGPQARLLMDAGATGLFGPLTKAALVEYQLKAGIMPASGYFGPLTRAKIAAD